MGLGEISNGVKVLGVLGSPRIKGNSDLMLERALEGSRSRGAEVEKIVLHQLRISPCRECLGCFKTGRCVIEDDFQAVYGKVQEAEGIIVSSPIFFTTVSAQLKTMIDRFQCVWAQKYVLKKEENWEKGRKKGLFLSVSALHKPEYFQNAKDVIKAFFLMVGAEYTGELFCPGIDAKGKIKDDPECLNRAYELGKNLIQEG